MKAPSHVFVLMVVVYTAWPDAMYAGDDPGERAQASSTMTELWKDAWDPKYGPIRYVVFSHDGRSLAALLGVDGLVVYDGLTGVRVRGLDHLDKVADVGFSPKGRLAVVNDGHIAIYRRADESWKDIQVEISNEKPLSSICFISEDTLACGAPDGRVGLVTVRGKGSIKWLEGHTAGVLDLVPLPDGSGFVSLGVDKSERRADAKEPRGEGKTGDDEVDQVLSQRRSVRIWDAKDGRIVRERAGRVPVFCIAVMGSGTAVVLGDAEGGITIWDWKENKDLSYRRPFTFPVSGVAAAQERNLLAAVSFVEKGSPIAIWGGDNGNRIEGTDFGGKDGGLMFAVAVNSSGSQLAASGYSTIRVVAVAKEARP